MIDYYESMKATRDRIMNEMISGLEGVPALMAFESGLDNGQDDWVKGDRRYDSEGEQMMAYGYGNLEQMGVEWLIVEVK